MEENKNTLLTDTSAESDKKEGVDGGMQAKTFTQDELDKVLKERLEREVKKNAESTALKITEAREEEKRLAKLSQDEREKELIKKQSAELEKSRNDLTLRENKISGKEKLIELKLPASFIDFVLDANPEVMEKRIISLQKEFNDTVALELANRMKSDAPKDPAVNGNTTISSQGQRSF